MSNLELHKVEINSLFISEITGKEHRHVLRDIETQLNQVYGENGASQFESTYLASNGREYKCFILPKVEALLVVSGYDATIRMKLIKRLEELENRQPQINPKTFTMSAIAEIATNFVALEENVSQVVARIDSLESTSAFTAVDCHLYQKAIKEKAESIITQFPNVSKGSVFSQLHSAVKDKFQVGSYKDLPHYKLNDVLMLVSTAKIKVEVA